MIYKKAVKRFLKKFIGERAKIRGVQSGGPYRI